MTFGKMGPLSEPSSLSNSAHSTPRHSDNEEDDEAPDSEEEREQLSKRITPASKVDVSSMEACTATCVKVK